jgi:Protein of unknown function (DUF3563)
MFARLSHVLHTLSSSAADRERDLYLASSTDLAELEQRMHRLELDDLHGWPHRAMPEADGSLIQR